MWHGGNVASVLIEKPARGDLLPILDGGYDLQYSPLLLGRLGRGMMLFCQLDVTGRSEFEPAAQKLVANILQYASNWQPGNSRQAVYLGDDAGLKHLQSLGIEPAPFHEDNLSPEGVLIIAHGAERRNAPGQAAIAAFLEAGGHLVAIALTHDEVAALLPTRVTLRSGEHIGGFFDPPSIASGLEGIGPADLLNRAPNEIWLLADGLRIVGDGSLGVTTGASSQPQVIFCQIAPWKSGSQNAPNLKRTFRRESYLLTRLLANVGVTGDVPLPDRMHTPPRPAPAEQRWLTGLYLDRPEEWDDPYRFFRW